MYVVWSDFRKAELRNKKYVYLQMCLIGLRGKELNSFELFCKELFSLKKQKREVQKLIPWYPDVSSSVWKVWVFSQCNHFQNLMQTLSYVSLI